MFKPANREPDFSNIAAVLEKKVPKRRTLFELFLNDRLYDYYTRDMPGQEKFTGNERRIFAFYNAGYDYAPVNISGFSFIQFEAQKYATRSLNSHNYITDRASFDKFVWNDPDDYDMSDFLRIPEYLPKGMKVMPWGPDGVLENVIEIVGYDNLCLMIYDDEQLVYDIFEHVGKGLLKFYKQSLQYDFVGIIMSNDDWGFNTQTMLSPADMRRFVFPWHKEIVKAAHEAGKYAVLHSCGRYDAIIEDVIEDMKFDGRHSYEDNIVPVEQAYKDYNGRLAVLGGMDINFMATKTPEEIYERSDRLFELTKDRGGFAIGTGNSVPLYVPDENYFAMAKAAFKD